MRFARRIVLSVVVVAGCGDKTADPKPDAAEIVQVVAHDISEPLRDYAKIAMAHPKVREGLLEAEPARRIPHPHMKADNGIADSVVQSAHVATPAIPAPSVNFEGVGAGLAGFNVQYQPPDTDGDIGDNDYFQVVNASIAIFSRTGTIKMGPVDTSTVWTNFNGACATTDDGDATIRYDHIAKRWVVAQFSVDNANGPFFQCVAVSTTDDPTGTYARYQFSYDAFNDYPKVGLWPDAYYFTFNMFPDSGFAGGKICAMDRTKMLAGDPTATMQCFDAGANFGGLLASDVDGNTLPAAGTPNYVVALDSNTSLAYWKFHVDFATPANSTFTGPTSITVSSYNPLCGSQSGCVKQPAGGTPLDSLGDRAMNRFVYRRFADHESLLFSHSVVAGASGGVRWYELRTPATPTVFQQGTFAPDASYRWLPSLAMDGAGDIAAIYTVSSATLSPSIRYTARVPSDAAGTMGQGEGTVMAGTGSQQGDRWGDYSALNIDPTDDCTFWGTHEYMDSAGGGGWSTRVASFRLAGCSSFAVTADAEEVHQSATASFPVTTATTSGSAQMVTLAASGLPMGVTATFNPASVMSGTPAMVTLTADATATLGMTTYTVTATGATSSSMVDVQLTVDPAAMADAGDQGGDDDGGGKTGGGCCSSSRGTAPYGSILLGAAVLIGLRRRRRS
jgi:hypothetical protein